MFSPRKILPALLLATVVTAGCAKKEITPLQRKQGASYESEAQFALNLRDLPRAESLLVQATGVCPDNADYWLSLGTVRRRMENRPGARTAFEKALDASRESYRRDNRNSQLLLQQVYILAVLGKPDEARKTLEDARKKHPDNRNIRLFADGGELDRLLADPGFKELSL